MREATFQHELIQEIKELLPNCIVMKTDPSYIQGFPDLLILYGNRWAALEVKRSNNAHVQPNQTYYIHDLSQRSFASFIFPENKDAVLMDMVNELTSNYEGGPVI